MRESALGDLDDESGQQMDQPLLDGHSEPNEVSFTDILTNVLLAVKKQEGYVHEDGNDAGSMQPSICMLGREVVQISDWVCHHVCHHNQMPVQPLRGTYTYKCCICLLSL